MSFLRKLLGGRETFTYEVANAALVHAMDAMARADTPENRRRLYDALLGSTLIIPTPELPDRFRMRGQHTAEDNTRIDMVGFTDKQGRKITPAFTDMDALKTWDPNTPSIGIKAQALFQMVMGTDFHVLVINPFDPIRKMVRPGGQVTRREIELLLEGVVPQNVGSAGAQFQMKAGEKVFMGAPAHPPSSVALELLRNNADSLSSVTELYLFQMATQAGYSHTVIGIVVSEDLAQNRKEEIVASLQRSVQPELKPAKSLDFMFLEGPMRGQVKELGTVIFRRP